MTEQFNGKRRRGTGETSAGSERRSTTEDFVRFSRFSRTRPSWPAPAADAAFHGLAGDIVRCISPHSEADPHAILVSVLALFGNAAGRGPGFQAEGDFHSTALFVAVVGPTSKGRKGTSFGRVRQIVCRADGDFVRDRLADGLSSGEGLIHHVRDPTTKLVPIEEDGESTGDHEEQVVDAGVEDKRLMVVESELAQALKVMARPGNTLSPVLRSLWDSGTAGTLTKNSPTRATGAHVSILGHITRDELRREMTDAEAGNGFANRFLFVASKRSKSLPDGGSLPEAEIARLGDRVRAALTFARSTDGPLARNASARDLWHDVYDDLSEGRPGLLGSVTGRAEAQVMRLAVIYALLDQCTTVGVPHLSAALALWRYCEASAAWIFGDALGDPVADELLAALRERPDGMARAEISNHFSRHKSSERITVALDTLRDYGLASHERQRTGGAPREVWFATGADADAEAP
jgi:hypothetical protein